MGWDVSGLPVNPLANANILSLDYATFSNLLFVAGWILIWSLRSQGDQSRQQDARIFLGSLLWKWRSVVQRAVSGLYSNLPTTLTSLQALAAIVTVAAGLKLLRGLFLPVHKVIEDENGDHPWVLPSRTTHSRMFPKRHSFSYSYLQVFIPVTFSGYCGSLISVGKTRQKGWFHVDASDYLERSTIQLSLKAKLAAYLQSQGIDNSEWQHAYLLTAPRFLRYSFNPVSFWYIYKENGSLAMMVLEVNNTFGERRMYLLEGKDPDEKPEDSTDDRTTATCKCNNSVPNFHNAWEKDFHVSPFNSRKGYYALTAVDPFRVSTSRVPLINNTIVLKSSKDHVKLIARVFSEGKAVNPVTATRWEISQFLLRWSLVGFLTFPRILFEAFRLFFLRRLQVWLRPEVLPTSIGRQETIIERSLESFFSKYLHHLVQSTSNFTVVYKSGIGQVEPKTFTSNQKAGDYNNPVILEIRVLSPAFFSRFIHYAHTSEAFDRECIFTDERNRTIWISRPELLPSLLRADGDLRSQIQQYGTLGNLRWNCFKRLRCPPASPVYAFSNLPSQGEDIRLSEFSPLDRFVQGHCNDASMYRRLCMRLFLAQRYALGFAEIVDALDLLIRILFISHSVSVVGTLLCSCSTHGSTRRLAIRMGQVVYLNLVHIWAYFKGMA